MTLMESLRVLRCGRPIWMALLAGMLAFGSVNVQADPATGLEALQRGANAVIRVNVAVGSLQRGGIYVARIDHETARIIVSDSRHAKIADYPFDIGHFKAGLQIWGAKFRWSDRPGCLVNAEGAGDLCAAEVLGPLAPDGIGGEQDLSIFAAWRLISHLKQLLGNPEAVVDRAAACPSRPDLRQTHIASRALAESLRVNGAALPFITNKKQRAEAEVLVDGAITRLLASTPPTSRTTYTQCYGSVDLITPFLVVRALDTHQRLKFRANVKTYLERLWPQLLAEGAIDANGARNARDSMDVANGYAAYLHIATVMERHGIRAYQDFTWRGLELLLANQTIHSRQTCTDAKGLHAQAIGGWPHSKIDCSQNLGYHDFIAGALIAVHAHLQESGLCRKTMAELCTRIEASLDVALAWVGGLVSGASDSPLLDRARGSSSASERPGAGDVAAAQIGFRILAHRRRDPSRVRPILVQALERTIRARPGLIPMGAYFQANASHHPSE
jgi:hypothetical protein